MRTGKGAGGEFVTTLKNIYGAVKPIVEFFTKHPKYIAVAIGAWAAYKTAAKAASAYTKLQLLSAFQSETEVSVSVPLSPLPAMVLTCSSRNVSGPRK